MEEEQLIYRSHREVAYKVERQATSSVATVQFLAGVELFS
jgi:hypothetical protein